MKYLVEVVNWQTKEKLRISVEEDNRAFAVIDARFKAMYLWGLDDDTDVFGKVVQEGD